MNKMEKEAWETVRKECEVSGDTTSPNCMRHCKAWIEMLDKYPEVWEKRLSGLDPSN